MLAETTIERFKEPSLWIEIGAILAIGTLLLLLVSYATRLLAERAHSSTLAFRPIRTVVRWSLVFLMLGLLVNRAFDIDLMNMIIGGLALVAIGVVAVWSVLSHTTATMLLIVLQPFRIRDWIDFPGEETGGKVIDLNLFYTLLDNEAGEHFIVPNNLFFQKTFRHVPGKGKEKIELHEQLARSEPASASLAAATANGPHSNLVGVGS